MGQQADLPFRPSTNRDLFAQNYLDSRLPKSAVWTQFDGKLKPALDDMKKLFMTIGLTQQGQVRRVKQECRATIR